MVIETKSFSSILFSTRYSWQFTLASPANDIEPDCWICLHKYFVHKEGDGNEGDATPECIPIKLPCRYIVGQHCFEDYRSTTNVEQCLVCCQKLLPRAPQTKPATLLGTVRQTL